MLLSCDTMVAPPSTTAHGQMLFAKNSDRPKDECQPLVLRPRREHPAGATVRTQFLELPQAPVTWRHVGSRPEWCWGYEHGFNEHQVAIGNEAVHSKTPEASEPKLVGMELIRLGLERGRTAAEAVEVMTDLIERFGQGRFANGAGVRTYDNAYIVADPREAYIVETAGHDWAVKRATVALGISNVHSIGLDWDRVSPSAAERAQREGWWSADRGRLDFAAGFRDDQRTGSSGAVRRARSCQVLSAQSGRIDTRTMMAALRDHHGHERPFPAPVPPEPTICMHYADDRAGNTAASLVADLCADGSRLAVSWCSLFAPCLGVFLPVFVEGELPPVLAVGGAEPDTASPWWLFHALEGAARRDATGETAARIRAAWSTLEDELIESVDALAVEARHRLDEGQTATATDLLTRFMASNVNRALGLAREMLADAELRLATSVVR